MSEQRQKKSTTVMYCTRKPQHCNAQRGHSARMQKLTRAPGCTIKPGHQYASHSTAMRKQGTARGCMHKLTRAPGCTIKPGHQDVQASHGQGTRMHKQAMAPGCITRPVLQDSQACQGTWLPGYMCQDWTTKRIERVEVKNFFTAAVSVCNLWYKCMRVAQKKQLLKQQ